MTCVLISSILGSTYILIMAFLSSGSLILRGDNSFGINPNSQAVFNACIIVYLLVGRKNKLQYTLLFYLLLFCVLAGTRKAFMVIFTGYIVYLLLNNPTKILKNLFFITIFCLLIYWLLFNVPFFYEHIGIRFETLFDLLQGGEGASSEKTRANFIEDGLYLFRQRPIKGYGLGFFESVHGTYSHNNYIELLVSLGYPGLIGYYCMHLYLAYKGIKNYIRFRLGSYCLGLSLLIALLVADYAIITYYERFGLFYLLLIAFFLLPESIIGERYKHVKSTEKNKVTPQKYRNI